jgi:hypothetical protein
VITAAVTPEPQVVTTGFSRSTPDASRTCRNSLMGLSFPLSLKSRNGTFTAPGICPDRMPGLGSGSAPENRPGPRASAI